MKLFDFFITFGAFAVLVVCTILGFDYLMYLWTSGPVIIQDTVLLRQLVGTVLAFYVVIFGRDYYNKTVEALSK